MLAAAITRHPREFVAVVMAVAATLAILVNALFLQHGPHPAPIFAARSLSADEMQPRAQKQDRLVPGGGGAAPQTVAAGSARKDPIAELIAPSPSKQMLAIQRALADFGYGQIKPTGVYDHDTKMAIEKFERDRNLPVDGQVSDRFVRALAAMTGRPIEQ